MILVTVGTHNVGFDRLVQPADELATELEERVVIQCGSSTYQPRYAEHFQLTSSDQMGQLMREATVIVAHAAAGTIIQALLFQKPLILVPRMACFGESYDDHQQELAAAIAEQGRAAIVLDPTVMSLQLAIRQVSGQPVKPQGAEALSSALRQQLVMWSRNPRMPVWKGN